MLNDWLRVEKVEFEKIPFIESVSVVYYKKNMRKSSSRKEYYSHIIICDCPDAKTLIDYWNDIVQDVAATIQSNLQDLIQAVNIYCCFFVSESVNEKTKQVIENDTYSSKKYIFEIGKECSIDEKLHTIDRKIFLLDEMEPIEVFDSEEPFFKGEYGGFYQKIYYDIKEKKPGEQKQIVTKAIETFAELLSENREVDSVYKLKEELKEILHNNDEIADQNFYKLKSVTLNNYRTYKGEATYDFLLEQDTPADFILIYSTNGLGKTSFFDAVEWALTGKINRLDDAIEENDYRGRILRNLGANEDDISYVEIEFSKNKKLRRTVKNYRKSDYGKGNVKGGEKNKPDSMAYQYGKDIVAKNDKWDDFILPHHKIDGVLSANSAEERYNNWGVYFDPNNNIRDQFKFLNSLWKVSEELLMKVKKEKEEAEFAKETLGNEKQSFANFCGLIKSYREITPEFLSEYVLDEIDLKKYMIIIEKINDRKVALCKISIEWENIPKYLNELIDIKLPNFKSESMSIGQLEEKYNDISKKLSMLVEKKALKQNKTILIENIKQEKELLNWLKNCKTHSILLRIDDYNQLLKEKQDNQTLLNSIRKLLNDKEEEYRACQTSKEQKIITSNLEDVREEILSYIHEIERFNIELENSRKNEYITSIKILENEIKQSKDLVEKKESSKILKPITEDSINIMLESHPENSTFKKLASIQKDISKYEKEIIDYNTLLDEQQKEEKIKSRVVDEVLSWVKLKGEKVCPVCHNMFSSNEDLIEEILKNKGSEDKRYSLKILDITKQLEEANKDKNNIIQEYNNSIEKNCSELRKEIERLNVKLLEEKNNKKRNEDNQKVIENSIIEKKQECLKKYKFGEPYTILHLNDWLEENKKEIQS